MGGATRLLLHFDEGYGTTAYDASGNELNGTLSGGTAWETGKNKWFRKCIRMDDVTEIVTIGDNDLIDFGATDSFTLSFWIYPRTQGSATVELIDKMTGTTGYRVRFQNDTQKFKFELGDGTFLSEITTDNAVSNTAWHYIVCIRDVSNDKLRIYVDGVQAATPTEDFTTATLANGVDLVIKGTGTNDVDFDDLEIRSGVLSASEIVMNWTNRNIGVFGGGDALLWDVDSDKRVYHWDHDFNGHMDLINGLIKLRLNSDDGYLYFYGFAWNGSINDYLNVGKFRFRYFLVEENTLLQSDNASAWDAKIQEVSPDRIIIRLYHNFDDYGISGMVDIIFRKGNRYVLFDFSMNSDRFDECAAELVSTLDYRFLYVAHPEGNISDSFLDAEFDTTGSILKTLIEDNFAIVFEENTNNDLLLGMFCTDDPTLKSDSNNVAPFGQVATSTEFTHLRVYTEKRQVGFILTQYDISTLFAEAEDHEGGGATEGSDMGNASNDTYVLLDATGEKVEYSIGTLEEGAYTAYFRLKHVTAGTVDLDIYNSTDAATIASRTVTDPGTSYVDVSLDFIIDGDDNGDTILVRSTWNSGTIWVDYLGIIPLSNSKNFIGDIAHQGLRKVALNRSGEVD